MVHTQEPAVHPRDEGGPGPRVTGWVGWVLFAGVMLLTGGFINIIEGIVALAKDDFYLVGRGGLAISADFTAWGWGLLLFGALLIVTGYGVMVGQTWARVTAIILAGINVLVNMVFLPAYPVWGLIVITLDVLVIYSLAVHGREVKRING
jgi:hypothetical protein